jgi:hypothetical protein
MVVRDHNKVPTGLAILGKVKYAIYNNTTQGTGIRDNEVPEATTMTEGETKIREARDRETIHPGMPQRPLSEDREGKSPRRINESYNSEN